MADRATPPTTLPPQAKRAGASLGLAIAAILAGIYAHEGGYVNDKADRGGPTNYGVTQAVARQAGFAGDMRDFPKHCASVAPQAVCADRIYTERYIVAPGYLPFVVMDPPVAKELVDTAVNMGPARPNRWLQQSLNELDEAGLTVDGRLGQRSVDSFRFYAAKVGIAQACRAVLDRLDGKQAAEYRRIAAADPSQRRFLNGWLAQRIGNVDRRSCDTGQA